jgi:hypothetical protein
MNLHPIFCNEEISLALAYDEIKIVYPYGLNFLNYIPYYLRCLVGLA